MCTEEAKESIFTSTMFHFLFFIFYANPGIRIPKALLSQSIIVSKYSIPSIQNSKSSVFTKDVTLGKQSFFFSSENSPFSDN